MRGPQTPVHYAAIVAASEKLGLPLRFRTDLTQHDRSALHQHGPAVPFLWCVGEDGTYMMRGPWHAHEESKLRGLVTTLAEWARVHWFFWDGSALLELRGPEHAIERLLQKECSECRNVIPKDTDLCDRCACRWQERAERDYRNQEG